MVDKEELRSLKLQLKGLNSHLKWCKNNNKPQEQLDLHTKVINEIKTEIKNLKNNNK